MPELLTQLTKMTSLSKKLYITPQIWDFIANAFIPSRNEDPSPNNMYKLLSQFHAHCEVISEWSQADILFVMDRVQNQPRPNVAVAGFWEDRPLSAEELAARNGAANVHNTVFNGTDACAQAVRAQGTLPGPSNPYAALVQRGSSSQAMVGVNGNGGAFGIGAQGLDAYSDIASNAIVFNTSTTEPTDGQNGYPLGSAIAHVGGLHFLPSGEAVIPRNVMVSQNPCP